MKCEISDIYNFVEKSARVRHWEHSRRKLLAYNIAVVKDLPVGVDMSCQTHGEAHVCIPCSGRFFICSISYKWVGISPHL